MQVDSSRPLHLTYCSNIHPGESWLETSHNIRFEATKVKARMRPDEPFGLGLRLSALATQELLGSAGALPELRAELDRLGMYVFTLNGFPYGAFHGTAVKQQVYRPDWREPERVRYTERLSEVLAALLPAGVSGSISTVPIGFRPEIADRATVERCVANVLDCAVWLWRLRERSGADIALAIEPEPACYLETTQEAIRFFERELLSGAALLRFADATGLAAGRAEEALRGHVGLCLDTCHAAVEFEHPKQTVDALRAAGIRVAKVQATTGLHIEPLDAARIEALRAFADPIYLHQVVARTRRADGGSELSRFLDLDTAFAALASGSLPAECWRVHFHVPVFERALAPFTNTQDFLRECIEELLAHELCDQFEVETYTWSVLPERYRTRELSEMIAEELRWTENAIRHAWSRA